MKLLRSAAMAFSMFSCIPMPRVEWERENMRYMLAALPLVGCAEAALLFLWQLICIRLNIGAVLFAAGMTVLPIAITGGVHLDGFCDTVDALACHGDAEKKHQVLKDPHTGAFAVIFACAYLIAQFALYGELAQGAGLRPVYIIPVLSRALSGFAGVRFPGYGESGLLETFRTASGGAATAMLCVWLAACAAAAIALFGYTGAAMLCAGLICGAYVYFMSKKQFDGMSGDLAGYLLQIAELGMLLALIIAEKAVAL